MSDTLPQEMRTFYADAADILVHNMMRRHDRIWGTHFMDDPARQRREEEWARAGIPWNVEDEGHRFKLFSMLGVQEDVGA